MTKKNQKDPLALLEVFQKSVLQNKPALVDMITEVHMMQFKIKPLRGDVQHIDFQNNKFIEILWSLGKLDEFFQKQYPTISEPKREQFFLYFDLMQKKLQDDLNKLRLQSPQDETRSGFEVEIFKTRAQKKKSN